VMDDVTSLTDECCCCCYGEDDKTFYYEIDGIADDDDDDIDDFDECVTKKLTKVTFSHSPIKV